MRPYGLRHAYVSLMIQAGHTVVEVAKWAGHRRTSASARMRICSTR